MFNLYNTRERVAIQLDSRLYAIIKYYSNSVAILTLSSNADPALESQLPLKGINFAVCNKIAHNLTVADKPISATNSYALCHTNSYELHYTPPTSSVKQVWHINSQRGWDIVEPTQSL